MPFPNPDTQFKPGNPGRPKGRSVANRLLDLLSQSEIGGKPLPSGKQVADLVAEAILKGALKGDPRLIDVVLNRTEGKVPDKVEVSQVNKGYDVGNPPEGL